MVSPPIADEYGEGSAISLTDILITGAGGYLGSYVVETLVETYTVTGFDLKKPAHDIRHIQGDILNLSDLVLACEGMDAVIHIAATPNISSAPPERIMQVNVLGTWNVLQAADLAGVRRVVLCSSDSTVGNTVWREYFWMPRYLPIDEDHPLRPTDPYGLSKQLAEEVGRSFAARGRMEVVALRPVFILFPEMFPEVIARNQDPVNYRGPAAGGPVTAGGGLCWHYIDPRDVAEGFRCALDYRYRGFESFFLAANNTLAPEPTLQRIKDFFGELPKIKDPNWYEDNPFAPMFDTSRSQDILGLKIRYDHRQQVLT